MYSFSESFVVLVGHGCLVNPHPIEFSLGVFFSVLDYPFVFTNLIKYSFEFVELPFPYFIFLSHWSSHMVPFYAHACNVSQCVTSSLHGKMACFLGVQLWSVPGTPQKWILGSIFWVEYLGPVSSGVMWPLILGCVLCGQLCNVYRPGSVVESISYNGPRVGQLV